LYHADGRTPFPYWHILQRPAGAINASPRDMAAYVRFLLNRGAVNGRQIVPRAAVERMERPERSLTARVGLPVGYGLHLGTYVDSGFVWVGHDGGVAGGITVMAYRPDAGVGFAFMVNSGNVAAVREIDRLVRDYLTRGEARPAPAPPSPAPLSALARAHAGWYRPDNPRVQGLYFVERLLGLVRVRLDDRTLTLSPIIGRRRAFVPVSAALFRAADEPVATLAIADDSADGRPVAIERMGYLLPTSYRRIDAAVAWLNLGTTAGFLLGSTLTVLSTLIWVPRRILRRLRRKPRLPGPVGFRIWALVATLAFAAAMALVMLSAEDGIARFGNFTIWSAGLFLCTLVFPAAAVLSLIGVVRAPRVAVGRVVWWFTLVVSILNVATAAYLGAWGVIGWRSWA
jgi:hypothetical protein